MSVECNNVEAIVKEEEKKHRCVWDGCEYESANVLALQRHFKAIHEEHDPIRCEFCDYVTKLPSSLKVHIRTVHGNERYPCKDCEYVAKIPGALNQHIKKVHGSQRYPCEFCEYVTKIPSSLKRHQATQHSNKSDSTEESHLCDQCSYIADSAIALRKHVEGHLPLAFPCLQCDYKTRTAKNLKEHIYAQHLNKDRYLCDKCEFATNSNQKMTRHKEKVHEGLTYPCEFCGFVATFRDALKKHMRRKHSSERYACNQCNYVAKNPDSLKHHIRSIHEGVRFPCPYCEYEAKRKYYLYDHIRKVHKKELDKSLLYTPPPPHIEAEIPLKKVFYQEKKTNFLPQKEETFQEQKNEISYPEKAAIMKFMGNSYLQNSLKGILENKFALGELDKYEEDTKRNPMNEGENDNDIRENDFNDVKDSPIEQEIKQMIGKMHLMALKTSLKKFLMVHWSSKKLKLKKIRKIFQNKNTAMNFAIKENCWCTDVSIQEKKLFLVNFVGKVMQAIKV